MCMDMRMEMRMEMRMGMCRTSLASSRKDGPFEYRHVCVRAVDMPSAMPMQSSAHGQSVADMGERWRGVAED